MGVISSGPLPLSLCELSLTSVWWAIEFPQPISAGDPSSDWAITAGFSPSPIQVLLLKHSKLGHQKGFGSCGLLGLGLQLPKSDSLAEVELVAALQTHHQEIDDYPSIDLAIAQ